VTGQYDILRSKIYVKKPITNHQIDQSRICPTTWIKY